MSITGRIYSDYFMPGRWAQYRAFLAAAKGKGYQFVRHQDADTAFTTDAKRLFFLRHDIDTDVPNAWTMIRIEREMGVQSTYYFRRSTADLDLMHAVLEAGSEVGYHYEEVADHIKDSGVRTREEALAGMDQIRAAFLEHFRAFEALLGTKVLTVAAHGDFANRYLRLPSTSLLTDELRRATGIKLEAYDESLTGKITFRAADEEYPGLWKPSCLLAAIASESPYILVLIHPRHWERAPFYRFRLDVDRLVQDARYRMRGRKKTRP